MKLRLEHDLAKLESDLGKLGPCVIERAAPQAINRVGTSVRATATRTISKRTGIKQKEIRPELFIRKAKRGDLVSFVDARAGRARNLAGFVTPAQRKPAEGAGRPQFFRKRAATKAAKFLRKGVRAKAWNKPKVYAGTFIARGRSGNVVVLTRLGSGRRSTLKALAGPSPRREFVREEVQRELTERAAERFPIEIRRSIDQQLKRCIRRRS